MLFLKTTEGPGWRRFADRSGRAAAIGLTTMFLIFLAIDLYLNAHQSQIPDAGMVLFGLLTLPWAAWGALIVRDYRVDVNLGTLTKTSGFVFAPKLESIPLSDFSAVTCWPGTLPHGSRIYFVGLKGSKTLRFISFADIKGALAEAARIQALTDLPLTVDPSIRAQASLDIEDLA